MTSYKHTGNRSLIFLFDINNPLSRLFYENDVQASTYKKKTYAYLHLECAF